MEEDVSQLSIITRRLDQIDQGIVNINRRLTENERRVSNNEERVIHQNNIISEMVNKCTEMNRQNAQSERSNNSQDDRIEEDKRMHSIINRRFLTLERAIDERSRHLRAIDRKINSLGNPRIASSVNASSVNMVFNSVPGDVIALREIQRGEHLCSLL